MRETGEESSAGDASCLVDYAVGRYLRYRDQLEGTITDPLVTAANSLGKVFGIGWVVCYPAEWLCWEEIIQPLKEHDYVPDFVSGFHAIPGAVPNVTVIIEYDSDHFPELANNREGLGPTFLKIDGFSALLAEGGKQVWIRSQLSGNRNPASVPSRGATRPKR